MNAVPLPVTGDGVSGLATRLIAVQILLLAFAIVAVVLRVVSIRRLRRKWKAHDVLCFIALVWYTNVVASGSPCLYVNLF